MKLRIRRRGVKLRIGDTVMVPVVPQSMLDDLTQALPPREPVTITTEAERAYFEAALR